MLRLDVGRPRRPSSTAVRIARSSWSGSSSAEGSEMSKPSRSRFPTRSRYAGHRRSRLAVERRAARSRVAAGIAVRGEQLLRLGSARDAAISRSSSADAPAETGDAPRISPSSSAGGSPVQSPTWARKSPGRDDRARGVAHVLRDHRRVVVAAAAEVLDELVVRERVRVDRLELAMLRDRRRLGRLVPLAELLAPQLAGEDLLRAREPLRDLLLGSRQHLL